MHAATHPVGTTASRGEAPIDFGAGPSQLLLDSTAAHRTTLCARLVADAAVSATGLTADVLGEEKRCPGLGAQR